MIDFDLDEQRREELLSQVLPAIKEFYANTKSLNASSDWDVQEIKAFARTFDLEHSNEMSQIIDHLFEGLNNYSIHTTHPSYYGLFNPRPNFASIIADLVTATYNPQLAAWSHSPFANEIESYVIQEFGKKFGYELNSIDGTFCTGGAEANLTAIICALNNAFPDYNEFGISGLKIKPAIYCSSESHHSIDKAARVTGLGVASVRHIPVNENLQMDLLALKDQISKDREAGFMPLVIIGTAGTTGSGAIDDLISLREIANSEKAWFHIDAAYGGGAIVSDKYKSCLAGIELSDSITLDLHKWFSIPMGASLFLTRNKNLLHQSFSVRTKYMPEDGDPNQIIDPYLHSIQWSRRFIGLKIYLPLAIHGWKGYEETINSQFKMGELFKDLLIENGWSIENNTSLPIICFSHDRLSSNEITHMVNKITASGKAWLSIYPINGKNTARVCITNYKTSQSEIRELIELLNSYKTSYLKKEINCF